MGWGFGRQEKVIHLNTTLRCQELPQSKKVQKHHREQSQRSKSPAAPLPVSWEREQQDQLCLDVTSRSFCLNFSFRQDFAHTEGQLMQPC